MAVKVQGCDIVHFFYTGLFEMIVGVLTTWHTQYIERGVHVFFYLIEQHANFWLHTLQVLYMCILCDSTNINTIIEFVPNCLQHVSGDGFNGGSDSCMFVESQRVHIQSTYKVCNKNLECCSIIQKITYTPIASVLCMTSC